MTDSDLPPGTPPVNPPPSSANAPGQQPSYGAPSGAGPSYGAPSGAGPVQTLSLTSFIVGLASVVFSWVPILGLLAGVAAVILGFVAKGREPAAPTWMWIVGVISGFVGIFLGIVVGFFVVLLPILFFGNMATMPGFPGY